MTLMNNQSYFPYWLSSGLAMAPSWILWNILFYYLLIARSVLFYLLPVNIRLHLSIVLFECVQNCISRWPVFDKQQVYSLHYLQSLSSVTVDTVTAVIPFKKFTSASNILHSFVPILSQYKPQAGAINSCMDIELKCFLLLFFHFFRTKIFKT